MYQEVRLAGYTIHEGYITNKKGKVMKTQPDKDGYPKLSLWIGGGYKRYFLHRLVAWEHCPNPDGKPHVNHKDKNVINAHPSNLEWVTRSENQLHARDGVTRDSSDLVRQAKELRGAGLSTYAIARELGIDQKTAWSYIRKE